MIISVTQFRGLTVGDVLSLKGLEILAPKEFRYIAIASENTTTNPPRQQTKFNGK